MHGIFDIIGPVMIGPSSSHTAGAVRLGLLARKILGEEPTAVDIGLHGSFAQTYRGHGTDKALIGGILGFAADDTRIRDALYLAKEQGVQYHFSKENLGEVHPNTAAIRLTGESGRSVVILGSSIGGGNISVTKIDGYDVELTGKYAALIAVHMDQPGIITNVTSVLAKYSVNVAFMRVSRKRRGEEALMILEIDEVLSEDVVEEIRAVYGVNLAFAIPPLE